MDYNWHVCVSITGQSFLIRLNMAAAPSPTQKQGSRVKVLSLYKTNATSNVLPNIRWKIKTPVCVCVLWIKSNMRDIKYKNRVTVRREKLARMLTLVNRIDNVATPTGKRFIQTAFSRM